MQRDLVSHAIGLAAPAASHLLAVVTGITSGRSRSLLALAVALISVVIGRMALARAAGGHDVGRARSRAIAALVAGLLGIGLSGLHLATATGAIGTGSGRLGAIVALVAGLVGTALGGVALGRVRRAA